MSKKIKPPSTKTAAGENDAADSPDDDFSFEGEIVDGSVDSDASIEDLNDTSAHLAKVEPTHKGSLSVSDPLTVYMRDIQKYKLLSAEETQVLAEKYAATGDVEAAKKLVTSNLRLVVKIAFDYRRAYKNILDLIQEGNIGLMQAVKKYDPYKGVKISSYAAWWIRAYILRFIMNNWRLVKIGTTQNQRKLFFNLKKERDALVALGIEPTHERIAARLDISTDDVVQMDRRLTSGEVSLDAPVSHDADAPTRMDSIPAESMGAIEDITQREVDDILHEKIHAFGKTLIGKEAQIFTDRLVADEPKTLKELGEIFGVSRERVRQIEERVQLKLKAYLEETVDRAVLEDFS